MKLVIGTLTTGFIPLWFFAAFFEKVKIHLQKKRWDKHLYR
ncbi:hypothetical protein [Paenibacillus arenilitoris]|nr:hypothetical protein [Paenibacillus arenilitoris]